MQEITPTESVVPVYLIPLTKEEKQELKKLAEETAAAEAKRASDKESAVAKLAALGLTEDEVLALIGR